MNDEYVADYASAVLPVLEWVTSNDWRGAYLGHFGDFYEELQETVKAPIEEILAELPTALWAKAARCCFEDFLAAEYESEPVNAIQDYLEECGSELETADVDFLLAFRKSTVRVYFVVNRVPYESIELRELSGGDRAIRIQDEQMTSALAAGDVVATRIVKIGDQENLAGSILTLSEEVIATFKQSFEETFKQAIRTLPKHLQKDLQQRNLVREAIHGGAASVLAGMWVATMIAALADAPAVANEDDPDTAFRATISYSGPLEPIVECLSEHPDTDRPFPKEFIWFWHADRENPSASLKALVWVTGNDICLESCEASRLEEAVDVLQRHLGDAVEEITISELTAEDEEYEDSDDEEGES